jgi:radical SAM protein with 4Fe4S-binding SPASM domain
MSVIPGTHVPFFDFDSFSPGALVMKTAWIFVGGRSNNRRSFCNMGNRREPDTQTLGSMLALAAGEGFAAVTIHGGEPTLRRDLPKIISAASSLGLRTTVVTNGRLLSYPQAMQAFVASGLRGVVVTLCGPDAQVHDRVTGTESFSQTVAGIKNALAAGLEVGVEVPVCPENVDQLTEIARTAADLGVASVCFRLVEAGAVENIADVPDLRAASAAVTAAVLSLDGNVGGIRCGYADFPCCLLPDLKGREFSGPRTEGAIFLADGVQYEPGGRSFRAMPVPCAACELRRGCSTVEPSLVVARGSGDLHLPMQSVGDVRFVKLETLSNPVICDGKCRYVENPEMSRPGVEKLFLVNGIDSELWGWKSGTCEHTTLMHTKNIRGNVVMASDRRIPTLDPLCVECENLSRCAAVFHLNAEGGPVFEHVMPVVQSEGAGSQEYLKWPDFDAGFQSFLAAGGQSPVRFTGVAPFITMMDSPDGLAAAVPAAVPAVEPLMLWEAARRSTMCRLVDYSLPYGAPSFSLDIQAADRWAEVDRMGTILIIRKCTMDCIICQVQKFYAGKDIMPLPDVVRFLEEFRLLGYTRLDLFGGEPTMRGDLTDLIAFAHRLGFYTDLITNGTLMTDELAVAMRDAGLDLCIVSLDGPTPEIHDKIRRVKDGHHRAVAGIEAVVRAGGMEVNVDTVVLPENIDHLIAVAAQVSALGATRINMFLCLEGPISSPVPRLLGFDRTLDLYERIIPEMRRIAEPLGTMISVGPRLLTAGRSIREVSESQMFRDITEGTYNVIYNQPEILCKAPDDEVYISLFGDVFPCTAPQMLESSAKMGNVYKNKLIEVVRSEKWNEFKKISGHHDGCRMCWRAHFDLDREGEERVLDRK